MIGKEVFRKLNNDAGAALLICGKEVRIPLLMYIASVEKLNQDEKAIKQQDIIKENIDTHKELVKIMRNDLGID